VDEYRTLSLKERLFNCYAANLTAHEPGLRDVFRCPICLREFGREAIDNNEVTKEHVPGGSLGGGVWTLTCRGCNCAAGGKLESELASRLAAEDWDQGVSDKPRRGRTSVGEGTVTVDVHRRGDEYFIQPHQDLSHPRAFRRGMDNWQSGVIPAGLEVEWDQSYDGLRSWVAVLRMGYLVAFGYFGYGYIMHPNLAQVREQIKNWDDLSISEEAVRPIGQWYHGGNLLGLLYGPSRLRCFFAVVEVSAPTVGHYGVVLLGLDTDSQDVYDRWAESAGTIGELQPKVVFLPFDPDLVCDPTNVDVASRIWRTYRKPLRSWAGRREFHYDGSVDGGTTIWYGRGFQHSYVSGQQYGQSLQHFGGRTVDMGASREPPSGSVGAWLMKHVTRRAIASYVGPILVHEGYAERVPWDSAKIRFK
jgi:hypothetical protein